MSPAEPQQPEPKQPSPTPLFSPSPAKPATPILPWAVAGTVILLILVALLLSSHRKPAGPANTLRPIDPYASNLQFTDLQMSESTSLSGGKSTFIDGRIHNSGPRTLTAATVQVLFANEEALPPQVETLPLTPIRTREPYVDTTPLSAAPLAPGANREFRLIFENLGANWNQQLPEIRVVQTSTR